MFKVGDRVRCIDSENDGYTGPGVRPYKNNIYTISKVGIGSRFVGLDNDKETGWLVNHFELINNIKEDNMKDRIEALTGWDKEADDILQELDKKNPWYAIVMDCRSSGSVYVIDNSSENVSGYFSYLNQCDKLRQFKNALVWMADKAGLLEPKLEGKEIKAEIEGKTYKVKVIKEL